MEVCEENQKQRYLEQLAKDLKHSIDTAVNKVSVSILFKLCFSEAFRI